MIDSVKDPDGGHWLICPTCKRRTKLVFSEGPQECWKCFNKRAQLPQPSYETGTDASIIWAAPIIVGAST